MATKKPAHIISLENDLITGDDTDNVFELVIVEGSDPYRFIRNPLITNGLFPLDPQTPSEAVETLQGLVVHDDRLRLYDLLRAVLNRLKDPDVLVEAARQVLNECVPADPKV